MTRLYITWSAMKSRCLNKNHPKYKDYGGRGIKVCKDWRSYKAFEEWALSHGYRDDLTIDRIDVDGNYKPSNCRWIPRSEQAKNKRNSRYVTYRGERKSMAEWAKEKGMPIATLRKRILNGWTLENAIETPVTKKYSHNKWMKERNELQMKEQKRAEVYSDYLDNLTIRDVQKMVIQGYYFVVSNGHVIAILPNGRELTW